MAETKWEPTYGFGRPLADMEVCLSKFHENQMYILVRTLIVSCTDKPSLEQINEALRYLMKWNPVLRMGIEINQSGARMFVEKPDADPLLLCNYNEDNWIKVMENEMLRPIEDQSGPLFRCTFLPNIKYQGQNETAKNVCGFVFTLHHSTFDGMSAIATLKKFLYLLNSIVMNKPIEINNFSIMHPPLDFFVHRALEELKNKDGGIQLLEKIKNVPRLEKIDNLVNPETCLFIKKRELESAKDPNIPYRTCLTVKEFSEEEINLLRLTCRENGATVQGAAQIAGSIAMAKLLQGSEDQDWEPLEIPYILAMNLRPHIAQEVPVDYAGEYMALLDFEAKIEKEVNNPDTAKTEFWKLAKEATQRIRNRVKSQEYLVDFAAFQGAGRISWEKEKLKPGEGRMAELVFTTSYGAWEFPSDEDDAIKHMALFCNSSIHILGPVFSQQLITVNKKLTWTIGWSQRVLNKETAEKFAKNMFEILENAVGK